ncbi:hypothetical protein ABZ816_04025 [Actinosynnema sp. NPDC047251]|uniref:Uncharacterized protein n=1 Tax=Saccharothrix espanaensis (strain ATCC 51144 / DSM 44229 / JCM 9112 / NBRC 15066 / NRRL 15764) TaxID=1179773 RepID=K0JUB2_SACES|nr:hypothetical protein [Saccharothrix espanaensis]CCH31430.1 hypothetical protein BN6_41430 [Saccharothrix espanaensis DSM 44229]
MPIAFDTTGLQQQDPTTWVNPATGDRVSLQYFDLVPDLPAALEDLPGLRHDLAVIYGESGCLIEAHTLLLGGVPALFQVLKLPIPNQPSGQVFVASFTVPRAGSSAVLMTQAVERGTTGVREAVLAARVGFERWLMPHPYAPELKGRLPFHAGDDPRFDQEFADHPLTRVRAWAHHVIRTGTVDPRFAALPPFPGPAAPPAPPQAAPPQPLAPQQPPVPQQPVQQQPVQQQPVQQQPVQQQPVQQQPVQQQPVQQQPVQQQPVQQAAPATAPVAGPGPAVGSTLTTVVPGIPIGGYLPLWVGAECTFWRMHDPAAVLDLLGRGLLARSPLGETRFRDLVALDPDSSTIVLLNRYRSDDGDIAAGVAELSRVSGQEADDGMNQTTLVDAFQWVGQVSAAAAGRGECVTVEPGQHDGEIQEPYVLLVVQEYEGQRLSVVQTAPAPPADVPLWEGRASMSGPATPESIASGGLLAMYAMDTWGVHPLHLCLTFGPVPNLVRGTG